MNEKILFIYDGECPFCNFFAELIELRSSLENLEIIDARENLELVKSLYNRGYDLNNGSIIKFGEKIIHGSEAVSFICSKIDNPSDSLLKVIRLFFKSKSRSSNIFPLLIYLRKFILVLKRKKIDLIKN